MISLEDLFEEDEELVDNTTPYVHIYWQSHQHDDIVIVWNHKALITLHRAITSAITKWEWKTESVFCSDWEGYYIYVKDLWVCDLSGSELPYL